MGNEDNIDKAINLLINSDVSNYRIAKETGIAPTTLTNYKTGKTKPTPANAKAILQYLTNRIELMSEQEIAAQDEEIRRGEVVEYKHKPSGIPLIPLNAVAGVLAGNSIPVMDYECEHYNVPLFKGADFLIQINGDSMQPKYYSGDIVACRRLRIDTFFQWNRSYVIDSEQGILLKRILPGRDEQHLTLVSENTAYPPFELLRDEIYSIALVVGVIRAE